MLLEVQVTRPGPARSALLDLLAPISENRELLQTLTTYVEESHRRAPTASRLHVHPNTLDYRLRRVRELTGLDPNAPEGRQLIRAALVVRRFVEGGEPRRRAAL
ncbi:PucR family transcriptional regulator [Nocardioides sp. JQ2195]|uniref:PucR family transcriptional regulator n=1 Tax=Nocardioides sp. JQ2195 TaxID=2592334 RepID=UPI00143E1CEE|nr:helix-turn-helix domain-containing protein [Nocardioides sp. JQ2195]QIX28367.1 PucR family transcriptional regulator [Nocardioides sp. JQ2195]